MRRTLPLLAGGIFVAASVFPAALAAQRASGSGQQATAPFILPAGLAVFELEHSGDGTFVVRLLDEAGAVVDTLVRGAGPFRGSKAVRVPRTGSYLYDVAAAGSWVISLRPPQSDPSAGVVAAARPPAAAPGVSPAGATAESIRLQATVDAEQAARRKGSARWLLGGLAGGTVAGPLGAAVVYVAASKGERVAASDVEARRAAHGDVYARTFSEAYEAKRRSDRRVASLVGGATGTVVFAFVIGQIVNWSRESGGREGPPSGEQP